MGKKILARGFTLIELLIVIGILGIIIVATLLVINPAEAQRKARDASRMKDIATVQTILTSYLEDGNTPAAESCLIAVAGCTTAGLTGKSQSCDSNWLGIDVCEYSQLVPLDPSNDSTRTCVFGGTPENPTLSDNCSMIYRVKISGSSFEVNVRQEAKANFSNVLTDGGNSTQWAEVGTNRTLLGD
jgi:prepilin-type N-terminal cleavage/methylation domain-containing protein